MASGTTGGHEKPREEWIEIPVPAIVSEDSFALAEERLEMNKIHAPRRTKTPSVVQGLVSCGKCGYALSSHLGPDECPQDLLLPLPGFRLPPATVVHSIYAA